MKCAKGRTFSEVIRKKHNLEVYAIMCNVNWRLIGLTVVLEKHFIMIRFGSPERDYSLSKGDMTLEKGSRSQHSKDVQLHDQVHSDRPRAVNELPTILLACNRHRPGKFSADKFSINT